MVTTKCKSTTKKSTALNTVVGRLRLQRQATCGNLWLSLSPSSNQQRAGVQPNILTSTQASLHFKADYNNQVPFGSQVPGGQVNQNPTETSPVTPSRVVHNSSIRARSMAQVSSKVPTLFLANVSSTELMMVILLLWCVISSTLQPFDMSSWRWERRRPNGKARRGIVLLTML